MTTFRVMKPSDLAFFMQLMDMVGWGMTPEDYQRILKFSPEGCFIAEKNGKEVGIVVTTDYGEIAWIGNIVVLPSHRGEGIGTELMRQAINYLKSTGTQSIRLDGVPQAIPLYR